MTFLEGMQQRYTVKKYDASKKIDPNKIEALKEILRLTPSSINSQPWKFTFVSNPETKQALGEASFSNKEKVIASDTVVVLSRVDNIDYFQKQIEEYLPQGAVDYFLKVVKPQDDEKIKAWFDKQVYIALGVLMSACAEMNLDSTPMEGIEPEKYDKILGLTDHHSLVAVAIGSRDENDKNQVHLRPKSRMPLDKVVEVI